MNPPLRSEEDRKALREGLLDGTIDCIATDHAPHTEDEKQQGLEKSPFGIVGLETAFSLLYSNLVLEGVCTLKQLLDWLTIKPANLYGLSAGAIEEGGAADLVLLDLNHTYQIDRHQFVSKGKNTPFNSWTVTGVPKMTLLNGKVIWKEELSYGKA